MDPRPGSDGIPLRTGRRVTTKSRGVGSPLGSRHSQGATQRCVRGGGHYSWPVTELSKWTSTQCRRSNVTRLEVSGLVLTQPSCNSINDTRVLLIGGRGGRAWRAREPGPDIANEIKNADTSGPIVVEHHALKRSRTMSVIFFFFFV